MNDPKTDGQLLAHRHILAELASLLPGLAAFDTMVQADDQADAIRMSDVGQARLEAYRLEVDAVGDAANSMRVRRAE